MTRWRHVFALVAFSVHFGTTAGARAQLIPRTPLLKAATITKPSFDSRLTVKFRDELKVRAG